MQAQAVRTRNSKGSVSILVSNDRLQLRFHFNGKRYYILDLAAFSISPSEQRFEGNFKAILCSNISIGSDGVE